MTCLRSHSRAKARIQDVTSPVHWAPLSALRLREGEDDWFEHKGKENGHICLEGFKLIRTLDGKTNSKGILRNLTLESMKVNSSLQMMITLGKHERKWFFFFWRERSLYPIVFPFLLHLFSNPHSHRHTTLVSCYFSFPWHIYHLIFILSYKPWYT